MPIALTCNSPEEVQRTCRAVDCVHRSVASTFAHSSLSISIGSLSYRWSSSDFDSTNSQKCHKLLIPTAVARNFCNLCWNPIVPMKTFLPRTRRFLIWFCLPTSAASQQAQFPQRALSILFIVCRYLLLSSLLAKLFTDIRYRSRFMCLWGEQCKSN